MIFGVIGVQSQDLVTFRGRPIVHTDRAELEFLLPHNRIVRVTDADLARRSPLPPLPIREHPTYAGLSFPLRREEFQ